MAKPEDLHSHHPFNISDFMAGGWITLKLTRVKNEFLVHKDLLCRVSPYFQKLLAGNFKEAVEHTSILESSDFCNVTTLEGFVNWLYKGHLPAEAFHWKFLRLLMTLHIFGDRYDVPALREQTLDAVYAMYKDGQRNINFEVYLKRSPPITAMAYRHLPDSSSMRKLLVDIYALNLVSIGPVYGKDLSLEAKAISARDVLVKSNFPREFLVDVLYQNAFFRDKRSPGKGRPLPKLKTYKTDNSQSDKSAG